MEQWNKGNKMLREIGKHEDPYAYLDQMEERLRGMESLASTHITWYTHKNPYGCWICDMFVVGQKVIDSFREFLGPRDVGVPSGQTTLKEVYGEAEEDDSEIGDEESAGAQGVEQD